MVEAIMGFTIAKPHICNSFQSTKLDFNPSSRSLRQCSSSKVFTGWQQPESSSKSKRGSSSKVNAFPDWHLMAVVDHMDGQRDLVTYKSMWHLSDQVCVFYIMFPCWDVYSLVQ
uniref:Uncharacterized protein n=1 Tax=Manihot esculenta TaxID=3983 RepID=A0A2C9VPD7_MANES